MRGIAKSNLQKFWERPECADAWGPLHSWHVEAVRAIWRTPQDIKDQYASASIVWVKFVGTHAQCDRIDVETVNEY